MPPPLNAATSLGLSARPMTDDDLPFVEALYASTRAQEVAATGWPPEVQQAFLSHQHRAQHAHYRTHYLSAEWLILELDGERIGRLYLDEGDRDFRIVDISLVPAARGCGLGEALLRDIIAAAGSAGKAVSIHVEINNPVRRLYERLGFLPVEDKGIYLLMEHPAGRESS